MSGDGAVVGCSPMELQVRGGAGAQIDRPESILPQQHAHLCKAIRTVPRHVAQLHRVHGQELLEALQGDSTKEILKEDDSFVVDLALLGCMFGEFGQTCFEQRILEIMPNAITC